MRHAAARWSLLAAFLAVSPVWATETESLLYNPGPRWIAGLTLATTPTGPGCHIEGSSLREVGAVAGRPAARPFHRDCVGGRVASGADRGAPTFYNDTRFGWTASDAGTQPGWSVQRLSGGGGRPIVWRYANKARESREPCALREVGIVYQAWPEASASAFRLNPDGGRLRIGEFEHLTASFAARLVEEAGPPRCRTMPGGYVTADFRIVYPADDDGRKILRTDLVGVVIHVVPGAVTRSRTPTVFWKGRSERRTNVLLLGARLSTPTPGLTKMFQTYEINLSQLLSHLPEPPPGKALSDAVIAGLDIYSAVRGADITFDVTDVDLRGQRR